MAKIIQISYDTDNHVLWCLADDGNLYARNNQDGRFIIKKPFLPADIAPVGTPTEPV